MKSYEFETKDGYTVSVEVVGEYRNSFCKDIKVFVFGDDEERAFFEETDDADEIMQWLLKQGVEFESVRSFSFNRHYIASVMIDGELTEAQLLDKAAAWDDAYLAGVAEEFGLDHYEVRVWDAWNSAAAMHVCDAYATEAAAIEAYGAIDLASMHHAATGGLCKSVERVSGGCDAETIREERHEW